MDRAPTPAFGLASSLEAMIEASLATSLERRLTAALNQQLGSDGGSLEDRIAASVNAALEQRLGSGALDGLVQRQISGTLDQRLGLLNSTLDTRIQVAVDGAVQRRLGTALRAQVIFDGPLTQTSSPAPYQDSSSSWSLGRRTSSVPYQHETIEREDTATLKQETPHGTGIHDVEAVKAVYVLVKAAPGQGSPSAGSIADETTTSVKCEYSVTVPNLTVKEEALPPAVISDTNAKTIGVAKPPARARKETPKKPKVLRADTDVAEDETSLFVEQDEPETETTVCSWSSIEPKNTDEELVNKPKKRTNTPAVSEKSDAEAPARKKAKKANDPPGSTDGPPIKFLLKKESKLSSAAHKRGHPRIVNTDTFTNETNKQNFTMADIVATILWNYKFETFKAFFDMEIYPKFRFVRVRKDAKDAESIFGIVREQKEQGIVVTCGFVKSEGVGWNVSAEYIINEKGLWTPHAQKQNDIVHTVNKGLIQQAVTELGTVLFLRKIWVEDKDVKISATTWTPEDASKGTSIFEKPGEGGKPEGSKGDGKKIVGGKKGDGTTMSDGRKSGAGKVSGGKVNDGKATDSKVEGEKAKAKEVEDEKVDRVISSGDDADGDVLPCR